MLMPQHYPGFTHPMFLHPFGGVVKRLADIAIAAPALIVTAPLLAAVACAVKLQDGGPALFMQPRIGLDGGIFTLLKFRTMVQDGPDRLAQLLRENPAAAREWAEKQKITNDPRITPLGRFLRRSSLDELPQLLNVLLGHMSIVGPRPMLVDQPKVYGPAYDAYCRARPGITGLWQVSGRNDILDFERWIDLDLEYARTWSLWVDLRILLKTVVVVLLARGAQ